MLFLAAPVTVIGVELAMRRVAQVVAEPLWWFDLFTQRKEAQLRSLRRRGGVDVVFIGTSTMLLGVDPDLIARESGLSCYNASIYRGVPTVSEAWLDDRVLRLARPSVVVVGMSPFDVNDEGILTTRLGEYRSARVLTAGPLGRVRRFADRHSYAVRHAELLAHPRRLASILRRSVAQPRPWRWRVPTEIEGVLGPQGQGLDFLDRSYHNAPRMTELIRRQSEPYANGGVQSGALRRIVTASRRHGTDTIFAAMPMTREYIEEVFPGGRAAWEREWDRLRELVEDVGTVLVDATAGFEDDRYYADMIHMNRVGRDAFSATLAAQLTPLLMSRVTTRSSSALHRDRSAPA